MWRWHGMRLGLLVLLVATGCGGDVDRATAKWVLKYGGQVTVHSDQGQVRALSRSQLPSEDFKIHKITWDAYPGDADSPIDDAALARLAGLEQLKELDLWATAVTDAGLVHLQGLTTLRRLHLTDTAVTDVGLEHLMAMPYLEEISLIDTAVTDAGVERLQQALPECRILR